MNKIRELTEISYETTDGMLFSHRPEAEAHQAKLDRKSELEERIEAIDSTARAFLAEHTRYKDEQRVAGMVKLLARWELWRAKEKLEHDNATWAEAERKGLMDQWEEEPEVAE